MASSSQNSLSSSTCACCTKILSDPSQKKDTEYSIRGLLQEQGCPLCRLIIQLLPESAVSQSVQAWQEDYVSDAPKCLLKRERSGGWQVYYKGMPRGVLTAVQADQLSFTSASQSQDVSNQIDFRLVHDWMHECEARHPKAKEGGSQRLAEAIDITLVDVIDKQLVRVSSRTKYTALSYVWGSISMFMTTVSTRPELEKMGGLAPYLGRISRVVQDAMILIQSIGERYLWADCLCIEQDHPAQKENEIAHMDIIYGQAFLTIVAISATDADSPLPGVRPGTRHVKEISGIIKGQRWIAQQPHFSIALQDAVYETRGWTMQEHLFSKRCLYLTKYAAYWSCCKAIVKSDNDASSRYELCLALQSTGNFPHILDVFRRRPPEPTATWRAYKDLLSKFTQRHLTYSRDTLRAFAGISAALQENLGTRFTSGLPDSLLGVAMLWTPENLHIPMQRNENFSSWSWAGWIGEVCASGVYSTLNPDLHSSTVPAFTQARLRIMIHDIYSYRQTPRRQIHLLSESQQGPPVVHEDSANDLNLEWDILCFSAFSVKTSSFYIAHRGPSVLLMDKQGKKCGVLYASPLSPIFARSPDEIVLLSKNLSIFSVESLYSQSIYPDLKLRTEICDWSTYPNDRRDCLYNIMLTTQKSDFAERLCLGCIHEDAWNASNPQEKQIVLR